MTDGQRTSHPFVSHYDRGDERIRNNQLDVIETMYLAYGHSRARTREALGILMWNAQEASQAVTDMQDRKGI